MFTDPALKPAECARSIKSYCFQFNTNYVYRLIPPSHPSKDNSIIKWNKSIRNQVEEKSRGWHACIDLLLASRLHQLLFILRECHSRRGHWRTLHLFALTLSHYEPTFNRANQSYKTLWFVTSIQRFCEQ